MNNNKHPAHKFPVVISCGPVSPGIPKKLAVMLLLFLVLTGCANYGTPKNVEIPDPREADRYSLRDWRDSHSDSDISFIMTFSGGGTRAARRCIGYFDGYKIK